MHGEREAENEVVEAEWGMRRLGIERSAGKTGKKALWQGAALLAGAAILSKLIGTLQKIRLQNIAGDEVFGSIQRGIRAGGHVDDACFGGHPCWR